jgi:hypothetical protein
MSAPTYPQSLDVAAGQPTAFSQYNNLRADALRLGAAASDAVNFGTFFGKFMSGVRLSYLDLNRLQVVYDYKYPPTLMINGFMCMATQTVALAAGLFSGGAAPWYVFAVRTPGSTTFTLLVNTNPTEAVDTRLIGSVNWNGTSLDASSVLTYTNIFGGSPYSVITFGCPSIFLTQASYSSTVQPHIRLDFGKIKIGARAAYLVANIFATSGTAYCRIYDTTNLNQVVEINTTSTTATNMITSSDILGSLPNGLVELRFEFKNSGANRVDCYWAGLIVEY